MKKKHKITLLIIGILLALSLMLSSSYALWVFNISQESTNVLVSDCFEITFTDGSDAVNLTSSFPMRDSDGVKTTPYTFTIKNICNHPADFQINLETLNTSTIDEEFIKADLNGHITEYNAAESVEPTIEGAKSAAMLYEDTLAVNGEKKYNLRIWVNELATQEDVGNKSYASKISVKATVRKQFAEGTLISGKNFNVALKKLADGGDPSYWTNNTSITAIEWSDNAPEESDNAVNIAATGTTIPIYTWFKDGTIYINSELDKIYMNMYSYDMFYNFQSVESLDLSHFDTSNVTDMSCMFEGMRSITNLDVSNFDTSNVTRMGSMFASGTSNSSSYSNLEKINGLENFDTSNVTTMDNMFGGLGKLKELNVNSFNTSKVKDMSYMFAYSNNLTELNIANFDTSNVTNVSSMFSHMSSLTSLDVSNFDTSKVKDMSDMFYGIYNLTSLNVINFNTSKVTDMSGMFKCLENLTSLDVSNFDTSQVKDMSDMFYGMSILTSLDVSHFDTSQVTNMSGMFGKMRSITSLNVSNFNTSNVTNMSAMFACLISISELDLSNFDTTKVINMENMFANLDSITYLDLSSFRTPNLKYVGAMFYGCDNLKALDLSNFSVSSVTVFGENPILLEDYTYASACGMFEKVPKLEKIFVLNDWEFSDNYRDDERMFIGSTNIVGGAGTTYDSNHIDKEYARVDDPANGKPGYFTYKEA